VRTTRGGPRGTSQLFTKNSSCERKTLKEIEPINDPPADTGRSHGAAEQKETTDGRELGSTTEEKEQGEFS